MIYENEVEKLFSPKNHPEICYAWKSIGDGQPIILFHGLGETKNYFWEPLISEIIKKRYRIYLIDLLGHGNSSTPHSLQYFKLENQAKFLQEWMEQEKIHNSILLGHSAGGLICLEIALNMQDHIYKIILYDVPFLTKKFSTLFSIFTKARLLALITFLLMPLPVIGPLLHKFRNPNFMRQFHIAWRSFYSQKCITDEFLLAASDHTYRGLIGTMWGVILSSNFEGKIKKLKCPTLIIAGKHDIQLPYSALSKTNTLIPNVKIEMLNNAAHFGLLEQPEQFIFIVSLFLENKL